MQTGVIRDGKTQHLLQLSELGQGFGQYCKSPSELKMAEGSFCSNQHVLGVIYLLGQQNTVNTGLEVFTDGIKLEGDALANKDGEMCTQGADNDRISISLEKHLALGLDPLSVETTTPWQ